MTSRDPNKPSTSCDIANNLTDPPADINVPEDANVPPVGIDPSPENPNAPPEDVNVPPLAPDTPPPEDIHAVAAGPSNPVAGPSNPVAGPSNPVAGPSNPVAGPSNPVAGPSNPVAGPSNPDAGPSNPVAGPSNPVVGASNPVAGPNLPSTTWFMNGHHEPKLTNGHHYCCVVPPPDSSPESSDDNPEQVVPEQASGSPDPTIYVPDNAAEGSDPLAECSEISDSSFCVQDRSTSSSDRSSGVSSLSATSLTDTSLPLDNVGDNSKPSTPKDTDEEHSTKSEEKLTSEERKEKCAVTEGVAATDVENPFSVCKDEASTSCVKDDGRSDTEYPSGAEHKKSSITDAPTTSNPSKDSKRSIVEQSEMCLENMSKESPNLEYEVEKGSNNETKPSEEGEVEDNFTTPKAEKSASFSEDEEKRGIYSDSTEIDSDAAETVKSTDAKQIPLVEGESSTANEEKPGPSTASNDPCTSGASSSGAVRLDLRAKNALFKRKCSSGKTLEAIGECEVNSEEDASPPKKKALQNGSSENHAKEDDSDTSNDYTRERVRHSTADSDKVKESKNGPSLIHSGLPTFEPIPSTSQSGIPMDVDMPEVSPKKLDSSDSLSPKKLGTRDSTSPKLDTSGSLSELSSEEETRKRKNPNSGSDSETSDPKKLCKDETDGSTMET